MVGSSADTLVAHWVEKTVAKWVVAKAYETVDVLVASTVELTVDVMVGTLVEKLVEKLAASKVAGWVD